MSAEVFYRFHQNATAPCFCADHAWSAPWGSAFTPDGSQYECPSCDGTGDNHIDPACRHCDGTGEDTTTCYHCDGTSYDDDDMCSECDGTGHTTTTCHHCDGTGEDTDCRDCDGTGRIDANPGYSCCWSPEDLRAYFEVHACGAPGDHHGEVIVFEGEHVGQGDDGEPLAIPTRVVDRLPWSAFEAKYLIRGEVVA